MAISRRIYLAVLSLLITAYAGAGEPYVPENDSEVLETLPTEVFAQRDRVAVLRDRLAASPGDEALAARIADHYVGLGKSNGDPRYFGYARAAIAPWWSSRSAAPETLRVRAKLKETDHEYRAALADLQALLEQSPDDPQAWVDVANIHRVLGEYDAAYEACDRLGDPADSVPALVARAPVMAVTGQAEAAYDLLTGSIARLKQEHEAVVPWALTVAAETARALGRDAQAEAHFREGLRVAPDNAYLIRSYTDFLLDRNRADEALDLVDDDLTDNGVLLHAAIAAKQAGRKDQAADWSEQLRSRFEETRLRGDLPHGRFEARYALELAGDPQRALELATANWARQKEHRDARNVLEAAIAAGRPEAAEPVVAFLQEHATQDALLEQLVRRLEERP